MYIQRNVILIFVRSNICFFYNVPIDLEPKGIPSGSDSIENL